MISVQKSNDIILPELIETIPGLFAERVARSPTATAYIQFDAATGKWRELTWSDTARLVTTLQRALIRTSLRPGDRVCQFMPNCVEWIAFDIAAISLGLVPVSIYPNDSAQNAAQILADSGARLLVTDTIERWRVLSSFAKQSGQIDEVWISRADETLGSENLSVQALPRPQDDSEETFDWPPLDAEDVATLIYTSGTTGRPKGVMLSHAAILWNAEATSRFIPPLQSDVFLSVLPLAHAFERIIGCYLPMMAGATVAFARSPELLREDLAIIRPSILLAVPRLYERIHSSLVESVQKSRLRTALLHATCEIGWAIRQAKQHNGTRPGLTKRLLWFMLEPLVADKAMQALGGRLRVAVSGGASLPSQVSHSLVGMGLPLVEGYGLTEAGPVVTACTVQDFVPGTVGWPLDGVQMRIADDGELQIQSPGVMKGYWQDETATRRAFTTDGWLHTGDAAHMKDGRLCIEGRLTDTIVLSTGRKLDLDEIESAIAADPLVGQVSVVGTGRPCPVALLVLNRRRWEVFAGQVGLDPSRPDLTEARSAILKRLAAQQKRFPQQLQIRGVHPVLEPWTVREALVTPTLKIKRRAVEAKYEKDIQRLYDEIDQIRLKGADNAQQ